MKNKLLSIVAMLIMFGVTGVKAQYLSVISKDSLNGKPKHKASLMGRLKLNGFYALEGNIYDKTAAFNVGVMNVNQGNIPGFWMDMRQSQLRFDGTTQFKNGKELFVRIEGDFENSIGDMHWGILKLRQAYLQYGKFLLGQTWSIFGEGGDMWPESMLDWDGAPGMLGGRYTQARFSDYIGKRIKYDVAAQFMEPRRVKSYYKFDTPDPNGTKVVGVGYAPNAMPDFVGSVKYLLNPGFVKIAGVVTSIGYRSEVAQKNKQTNGYGMSGMLHLFTGKQKQNNVQIQVTAGQGIAAYLFPLGGSSLVGRPCPCEEGVLDVLNVVAGYASYQHYWTDKLSSMALFSYSRFDGKPNPDDWDQMQNLYALGNVMYNIMPNFKVIAEYIWGQKKETYTDRMPSKSKNGQQLNFGIMYNF